MADTWTIIETVFQAMVSHRPRLARFLEADDDGDAVDVRELADQVVKGFPYPIGVELRRLFSSEHQRPDRGRLDQLFKTIERTLQFTAFVLFSQILEDDSAPADGRVSPLCERLLKPGGLTMGDFAYFINALGDWFRDAERVPFMPELAAVLNKDFYARLNFWTPERNAIGHYLINLDAGEIERRCVEYSERLAAILADLAFLVKYPLVSMLEIRVEKTKGSPVRFSHLIKTLSSASSNPSSEALCATFSDSHAVLLLKSMKDPPTAFLNLSPLIIDTHQAELVSREQVETIKKDIFLFSRRDRDGRLRYVGTTVTEQCDLRCLPCYGRLQAEFGDYLKAAGLAPAAGG
jgi:hypothetical protein